MTYNSKIHFYNINGAKLSQPQQMTVGDVHDMFVPLADGLLTSIEESEAVIDILMEQIPQMFSDTRETETVLGPVIQAGKEAFKVILVYDSEHRRFDRYIVMSRNRYAISNIASYFPGR